MAIVVGLYLKRINFYYVRSYMIIYKIRVPKEPKVPLSVEINSIQHYACYTSDLYVVLM